MNRHGISRAANGAVGVLKRRKATRGTNSDAPKRVWSSLEVAKIAVGVTTPLMIALLTISVSTSMSEADRELQQDLRRDANERERAARLDAERKEAARDLKAELKVRRDRLELFQRETALSDQAFAREQAKQRQADAREAAILAEARKETRRDRIYSMRHEAWKDIGPRAVALNDYLNTSGFSDLRTLMSADYELFSDNIVNLTAMTGEISKKLSAVEVYFSPSTISNCQGWLSLVMEIKLYWYGLSDKEARAAGVQDAYFIASNAYERCLGEVRRDLLMER